MKDFIISSSGGHLVQRVSEFLVDSHLRNIPVKLFQNLFTDLAEGVVKRLFLLIALAAILFNSGTVRAIFVDSHLRKIPV